MRTTAEVLRDHLDKARRGQVEDDIRGNYAPDVVVLSRHGVDRGHDGLRRLARLLKTEAPGARFRYTNILVEEDVGFLEWEAEAEGASIRDGADSFMIRDGRIVAQTIHYRVDRQARRRGEEA